MQPIDLGEMEKKFKGKPFTCVIQAHLDKTKKKYYPNLIADTIQLLPEEVREYGQSWIKRWESRVHDKEVHGGDCDEVLKLITKDAKAFLYNHHYKGKADDKLLFYMFQLIVLHYAQQAAHDKQIRSYFIPPKTLQDYKTIIGWVAAGLAILFLIFG